MISWKNSLDQTNQAALQILSMNLNNNAWILELGGGTGVIGRAYIKETNFNGKYVVSDLSEQLLKFGKELAIKDKVDHLLDFKMIDAMASKTNNELFYDAVNNV